MKAANVSKRILEKTRVAIWREGSERIQHSSVEHFSDLFCAGDLIVVNRSGTMPSSFRGKIERTEESIELRLASFLGDNVQDLSRWRAVSFGAGDWRVPTEQRGPAPAVRPGDEIWISKDLVAIVRSVDSEQPRLLEIQFSSLELARALFESGKPIQYSYLTEPLDVWDQQTIFAGPPISVEPPSAAFPLTWRTIRELEERGVKVSSLLHGAGLSSTGDSNFDKLFPLDEFFEIPSDTIDAVRNAKKAGGRVFALGTTVARAVESAFAEGINHPRARGRTALRLSESSKLIVVDALITGMHEADTSHFELMRAFVRKVSTAAATLEKILSETTDYRSHEYGDLTVLMRAKSAV